MKLYEVRRFSSEKAKWATEYVKRYTKEIYTKKYLYTPEVLKLDDGRTKYTLCIKAKQVATACKYLTAYFGEEIQNLSSIVADILANDPKTKNHTEYTVHGDGYTCCVYVGDDAGNIHIALYLDAEASEESNTEETETQTETNEETKEEKEATKLAERYTSKEGFSYAIITERKDRKFFVMTNCGENVDKYRQWKIFDTYEEAHDYLRDAGYFMVKKIIEIDSNTGEGEKCDGEIVADDEAPVKVFSSFDEYKSYFDEIPIRRVPLLVHKGDALLVDAVIRADDLDTAIRRTCEIYADYPSVLKAIEKATAGDDRTKYTDENIKWRVYCSDLLSYKRYRICLDVAEEPEEAQKSDDVHETNARLEIVKLKNAKFGTPRLYKSVTGYAFYDAKKGGYWAYSAHRDKHGILAPYTPCGGREALEKIVSDGGFVSYEGMEIVKPLE